ncbi:hypothetical protein [Lentzea sp. NPDC051838]|uniref:DUF7668 domain-containing protein n=1 Tax=Lentzea sp. NPDC051838 TaxID=3154849 RepID=UPI00342EC638
MAPREVQDLVRRAVGHLAAGQYAELEGWTTGLPAQDMAWALDHYGVRPVLPPDDELFSERAFHFDDWSDERPAYHVEVALWTGEGASDLRIP